MKNKIILVNFKNYRESVGRNAVKLAKKLDRKNIWLIVNPVDLKETAKSVKNSKVLAEHADPVEYGKYTGSVTFPEIKAAKAYGVFLNHSEKKISFDKIRDGIKLAKKYRLKTVVSSSNLKEAETINKLKPDYVAIEPAELISGKISVSNAKPELIKNTARKIKNLIVGAGIHTKKDVDTAYKLGAKGILISSAIVKSKNPARKLMEIYGN